MVSDENNQRTNDQLLISEIYRKNKKVFESVYKQYYKSLYTLSYQYVMNHESAEETVHDVFINIWNKPGEIVLERSLRSYLFRSVINASLNFLKKERSAENRLNEYTLSYAISNDENLNEPADSLQDQLEMALAQLPPQCRKVMMLSRFGKLKQQEIADQMGISIKTVKNHLTYGFNKMRGILYK